MAESKTFNKVEGVTVEELGNHLTAWFRQDKGMQADGVRTENGFGIQAREEGDGWKTISGTTLALQVNIIDAGNCIVMECAYGKWSDKVGAAAVGWFVFAPLMVTAAIGSVRQKKLPDETFQEAERFLLSGGRSLYTSVGRAMESGETKCLQCGKILKPNQKFCPECGAKVGGNCPQCGAVVESGEKFCSQCGAKIGPAQAAHCSSCGMELDPGASFCSGCGMKVN